MAKITKSKFKLKAMNTGGIITRIAEKIGVSRKCLYEWIHKNEEFARPILEDEREKVIDVAENSLFQQAQNKEKWATKYILSTIGKSRGYYERQEHDVSSVVTNNVLTAEEKETLLEDLKKSRHFPATKNT